MNIIYLRISNKKKEIEIHTNYDSARAKGGLVRKFKIQDRYLMRETIRNTVGQLTEAEINRWTAPTWVINWLKRLSATSVYITQVNNFIYYKFKGDLFIDVIDKSLYLYDINQYIYYMLVQIAEFQSIENLEVFTDIADLLRINRIHYNQDNKHNIFVKLMTYENLADKMEGYYE